MPARAIGTATVSFGLVSIPVKLYSATQPSAGISFNMLHDKCQSRLKQQYTCPKDGEIVPRDQMVKGYEFAKDQYVTFTAEELEALEEKATKSVDITEFVPASKVDPVYFEKAYYLGPDKGGDRAYKLLATAMERTGKSALAKYAARGKTYIVLVRALGGQLVMQQLYYADEIRDMKEVPVGDSEPREAELKLAMQLVEQSAVETFNPGQYEDEVKKRIEEAIQRKVEGHEVAITPVEEPQAQIIDLMEALKMSLSGPGGGAKPVRTGPPAAVTQISEARAATGTDDASASAPDGDSGDKKAKKPAKRAAKAKGE